MKALVWIGLLLAGGLIIAVVDVNVGGAVGLITKMIVAPSVIFGARAICKHIDKTRKKAKKNDNMTQEENQTNEDIEDKE